MGTAAIQGPLWGAAAEDWAEVSEPGQIPFYEAAFDALGVGDGTTLLDVGCGAGLALVLAAKRGATVTGIDAAEGFLRIARARLPEADLRHGDIEELPYDDLSFDRVTAFNSVQYAADPIAAFERDQARCVSGGRIAVVTWGRVEQCEMRVVLGAIGNLLPPPPPGAGGPFALAAPGALEALIESAGLTAEAAIDVPTPYIYPDLDTATRAQLSSGPARRAIDEAGFDVASAAIRDAMATGLQTDGTVRLDNVFKIVTAHH